MLVITRKQSEFIRIGDDIEVCVVRISKNKVRLGISAPKEMAIVRTEIAHKKRPEGEGSSGLPAA